MTSQVFVESSGAIEESGTIFVALLRCVVLFCVSLCCVVPKMRACVHVHFDLEVGGHDGAHKGRIHVIVPFIGRKNGTLIVRQQSYDHVHGWDMARIEQLFARLWHWGLVRNIWRGAPNDLH